MIKKFLSLILIISMAFCIIVMPTEASAAEALVISADTQSAKPGETVTITLSASNNPGLSFLQVTLRYDTSALTLESATNGNVFSTFEKGVNLQWSADEDSTNNGTLATLKFKVNENATAGNYAVKPIFREAYDSDLNDVSVKVNEGAVILTSELSGVQTVEITSPVKGAAPQSTIAAGTGYTGTISWNGNPAKFAADTVYSANITLTASAGYVFDSNATGSVAGATITNNSVSNDGSTLTFKATFPKTAGKATPVCTAPSNVTATYGQKLSDVTLSNPSGNTSGTWSWITPSTSVGNASATPKSFKAKFVPADSDNYVTVENIDVPVIVNAKSITVSVAAISDQEYTGNQIKPAVVVTGDGKTLVLNTDYTVEYGANVNAGTGSVTVKAKANGNYTFTNVVKSFNIIARTYTITYNANGGSGAPASQTKTHGVNLTLSSTKPTRDGYTFKGWGTVANGNVVYNPGSSYASDKNITLYAIWESSTVSVTGITLNKTSASLKVGENVTLTATVAPSNATNKAVTWTTSNASVATVANGVVTAKAAGSATITAKTSDGGKTASCSVTVTAEPEITSYDAVVYTTYSKSTLIQGAEFTFTVSLSGTYDGYSFKLPKSFDGIEITSVVSNDSCYVDDMGDRYMISVLGGKGREHSEKITIATVTAKVDENAALGEKTLSLDNIMLATNTGEAASFTTSYAVVNVTDSIPGDINGDGKFDYYDVSKLYAFYRNKTTLDAGVDSDINGSGSFDYYDVSKLYAIYRGKAEF